MKSESNELRPASMLFDKIAEFAVENPTVFTKLAADVQDANAKKTNEIDYLWPVLGTSALGALAGAMATPEHPTDGDENEDASSRMKRRLKNAIIGAGAGGLIGAGGTFGLNQLLTARKKDDSWVASTTDVLTSTPALSAETGLAGFSAGAFADAYTEDKNANQILEAVTGKKGVGGRRQLKGWIRQQLDQLLKPKSQAESPKAIVRGQSVADTAKNALNTSYEGAGATLRAGGVDLGHELKHHKLYKTLSSADQKKLDKVIAATKYYRPSSRLKANKWKGIGGLSGLLLPWLVDWLGDKASGN